MTRRVEKKPTAGDRRREAERLERERAEADRRGLNIPHEQADVPASDTDSAGNVKRQEPEH